MRGISKRYGIAYALRDVDFEAQRRRDPRARRRERRRQVDADAHPGGRRGRATTARMEVDGQPYAPRSPHDARSLGIRAVHQEFSLVPHLSVAENLLLGELPTRARGIIDWPAAHRAAGESLAELGFEASTRTSASAASASRSARWSRSPRRCAARRAWSSSTSRRPCSRTPSSSSSSRSCAPSGHGGRHGHLRVAPPRRGPGHLRPRHGAQGWRARGHPGHAPASPSPSSSA